MPFQKGHKINLGRRCSQESRKKMSEPHMGTKTALKHGNSPYKNYHIMQECRIALLKRTKGRCELCDNRGRHIHHLDNSKINHDLENLILVCSKCHSFLHATLDKTGRSIKPSNNTKYGRIYGMSLREIGEKLGGVSRQAVYNWVRNPKKEAWVREKLNIK